MAIVPALGASHVPQLIYDPDKESYVCDRAGLFHEGETYGDEMPGVKGEGCHLFACGSEGDLFLTVKQDGLVLKTVRPGDFGLTGQQDLDALLVRGGQECITFYAPAKDISALLDQLKKAGVEPVAHASGAFTATGPKRPYVFNADAAIHPL